jgi:hypothetical protein
MQRVTMGKTSPPWENFMVMCMKPVKNHASHDAMLTHLLYFLLQVSRAPKVALFYWRTGCGDKGKIDSDG